MKGYLEKAYPAILIIAILIMWNGARWTTSLPEVGMLILAGICIAHTLLRGSALRADGILLLLAAVLGWIGLQLTLGTSVYQWRTSVALLYWAANTSVFFVGLQILSEERARIRFLNTMLSFGFLISVLAPVQALTTNQIFWLFQPENADGRSMGPFVYTNQYAAFIELLLPIALVGLLTDRRGWKPIYALAVAVMYASVIVSGSRGGFILVTLEVILIPILLARRDGLSLRQTLAPVALVVGMFVVLAVAGGPDFLAKKFQEEDPYSHRREFVKSSLAMLRDRPLTGFGLGNWAAAYPAYSNFDDGKFINQAHNDWVQWAVEGGLPFAALMLGILFFAVPNALRTVWGLGCPVVFIHCTFDYPIQRTAGALLFFAILAAIAASHAEPRNAGYAE